MKLFNSVRRAAYEDTERPRSVYGDFVHCKLKLLTVDTKFGELNTGHDNSLCIQDTVSVCCAVKIECPKVLCGTSIITLRGRSELTG